MAEDSSTRMELGKGLGPPPLEALPGGGPAPSTPSARQRVLAAEAPDGSGRSPATGGAGAGEPNSAPTRADETSGEHPLEPAPSVAAASEAAPAAVTAPAAPAAAEPPVASPEPVVVATETRSATLRRSRSALEGVRGGLREAGKRLDDEARLWDAQAEAAVLPAIGKEAPLVTLVTRVDRESAYWRSFAVRNLRPGAARNIAVAGAALALTAGLALGLLATLATLVGSGSVAAGALWAAGGVTACALIATLLGVLSERGRVMAAREALARADHAERRLERIVAILALEDVSGAKYADALARLERER